ncbi:uncharacterized protein LOC128225580 [Mya arenaria]|uniref:uncharacterized protein LOC128225580 n=1 Tax=Mya arenaria TaxID=6604 RepID=UPI0022E3C9F2|nr:uncharacterized protein LOC128225580 [Mya arenaria]
MDSTTPSSTAAQRTGALLLAVTTVVHVVGYSTNYWRGVRIDLFNFQFESFSGLWKHCYCSGTCGCENVGTDLPDKPIFGLQTVRAEVDKFGGSISDWMRTVQILESVGLCSLVLTAVLVALTMKSARCNILRPFSAIAALSSAALILVGLVIYGSHVNGELHYSFGLCCAGVVFAFITSLLLTADARAPRERHLPEKHVQMAYSTDQHTQMAEMHCAGKWDPNLPGPSHSAEISHSF